MPAANAIHSPLVYTRDAQVLGEVERCVAATEPGYLFRCGYPTGNDWIHTLDLVASDPHHLRRILLRLAADATEAASRFLRSYAAALVHIATATYLALPYVPDLAPSNVQFCFDDHGALAALALCDGRCIATTNVEVHMLRCWLWRTVVHEHLAPLVEALNKHTGCPAGRLWHTAATACAEAFLRFDAVLTNAPGC